MPQPPALRAGDPGSRSSHFRAHGRRPVRLTVGIVGERSGVERHVAVVDVSLAGAGVETEAPLVPGERLAISLTTPSLWDPLVIRGVVAWAQAPRAEAELDPLGRPRVTTRAGVAFEYPDPGSVLAMFDLLASLDYE